MRGIRPRVIPLGPFTGVVLVETGRLRPGVWRRLGPCGRIHAGAGNCIDHPESHPRPRLAWPGFMATAGHRVNGRGSARTCAANYVRNYATKGPSKMICRFRLSAPVLVGFVAVLLATT